jgi:hypothetical protein
MPGTDCCVFMSRLCGGLPEACRGNRPARGVGARPVPPHPSPLPKEREHHRPACCGCGALRFIARRDTILPLPKGAGQGEGEWDGGLAPALPMGFDIRLSPERLMTSSPLPFHAAGFAGSC